MLALLVLSGFFSSSETALMSVGRIRIRHLAEKGDRRAQIIQKLRQDPNKTLGPILVGNNIVNIALTSLATALCLDLFGDRGLGIAMASVTGAVLLFGEVLPKGLAACDAEATGLRVARAIFLVVRILTPLAWVFTTVTSFILRLAGKNLTGGQIMTAEEFRTLVDAVEQQGVLDTEEKEMIEGIVQFSDTSVSEIMVPRPDMLAVSSEMPVSEASQILLNGHFSRLPVYQGTLDNVIGFVHVKDLAKAMLAGKEQAVKNMVRPVIFVPHTRKVDDLFRDMRRQGVHMAIVLDEYGSTMGLVTMEDLLEEIVGDIRDEYDSVEEPITTLSSGVYLVHGGVLLEDLAEETGVHLSEEEVDTVGGYVFHKLGHIPRVGDVVEEEGVRLTVEEMRGKRVSKVKVERVVPPENGANSGWKGSERS